MITRINKLKGAGIFLNFKWNDAVLPIFGRYNLIYGWNGSGKTTLSKVFSYIETGASEDFPNLQYEIETDAGILKEDDAFSGRIRTFNQDYVNKNVQPVTGKANSIFILGEDNKEISEQVEADKKTLDDLENKKRALQEEKDKKEGEKGKKFTAIASVIGANLVGSSTRNYRKPDAERDFTVLSSPEILNDAEISRQQSIIKQEQKDKILKVEFDAELDLLDLYKETIATCNETVESSVIEALTTHPEISEWVEKGLSLHNKNSPKCEFCGETIPAGRIEALLGHFNEADKKLKSKIDSQLLHVQDLIQASRDRQIPNKAQFYADLQTKLTSRVISYNQEKENFVIELSSITEALNSKKSKTTEIVHFSKSLSNNFKEAVASLNELIDEHNQKSENFQSEKDKAADLLKKHHLSSIFDEVKALDKEIEAFSKEITRLENGDSADPHFVGIPALKKRINENKGKISSEHRACDFLNRELQTFLGRNEITFEVAADGGYAIKRNNVLARNLSEGEKTAIAFLYFVIHLKDQDFDLEKDIIVIDDPISSLDSNSLFQAFAFLKNAVKDAKQVFLLTHNFDFLKLLLNWLGKTVGSEYYMIKNQYSSSEGRSAHLSGLDKDLRGHESEYHYLFKILYSFETDGSIASVYHIPNIARKVLETFLMFRVPSCQNLYQKMETLTFDENKKTAIYKYTNDQSHITGSGFDPSLVPETQKNVRYLLEMMETVFPEHYKILVNSIHK